jgi:hypothetical protein
MKIQVVFGDTAFTYWIDSDVKVGDTVMLPKPWWNPSGEPREAQVAAIGSDYDGPLVTAWLPRIRDAQ